MYSYYYTQKYGGQPGTRCNLKVLPQILKKLLQIKKEKRNTAN